jgi:tetratricopeptide (TPR) repeat protein
MNAFNEFFKDLAEKMKLPEFFKGTTLIFNNLFLVLLVLVCLIALLLVIFLVPGKKKKKSDAAEEAESSEEPLDAAAEEPASEVVEEAKSLVPNVYMRKGSTLLKEKNFAGAAAALSEVTKLTPEDGMAFLLLGQAQMQAGSPEAIASLEKANELGETQAVKLLSTNFLKQGQALLKAGKNADAIAALEKSNSYVESANAYLLMASAYTKSGKSSSAIDAYKKYLELAPNAKNAEDIIFTIAATAQKAGDKATAKEYYKKLAGSKYAAQAEAQLKSL